MTKKKGRPRRQPRPSETLINVRVSAAEAAMYRQIARAAKVTLSEFVRRAVRADVARVLTVLDTDGLLPSTRRNIEKFLQETAQ